MLGKHSTKHNTALDRLGLDFSVEALVLPTGATNPEDTQDENHQPQGLK